MQTAIRLKVVIPVIFLYFSFLVKVGHSDRPPIAGRNREIGSKWAYLYWQYVDSTSSASISTTRKLDSTTTSVTTKATTTTAIPIRTPTTATTTKEPSHFIRIPEEVGCGIPKSKPMLHSAYVIGGQLANAGEFPWFAAITKYQYNKNPNWKVICGASLLNSKYAITAAHCLHGRYKDTLEVVFNLKDTANIAHAAAPGEIRRKIARFVIHPQYNSRTQHEDIALIQFKEPIDLRREKILAPICLPESDRQSYASKNGTFTGFGHTNYGSASSAPKENSRYLMKVQVPILSHAQCLKTKVPTKKNVTENMICAGDHGRDACINDSGGPLMVNENGKTVLIGIASWGVGCALQDYPGIYTRTQSYLRWIKMASSSS